MARAKIKIWYQELPPDLCAHGGVDMLKALAVYVAQRYRDSFTQSVVVPSKLEDRITGVDVMIQASLELNYDPSGPRLWVELVLPISTAGNPALVSAKHLAFLTGTLTHDVPEAGDSNVLKNETDGKVGVAIEMSFATIHHALATPD